MDEEEAGEAAEEAPFLACLLAWHATQFHPHKKHPHRHKINSTHSPDGVAAAQFQFQFRACEPQVIGCASGHLCVRAELIGQGGQGLEE